MAEAREIERVTNFLSLGEFSSSSNKLWRQKLHIILHFQVNSNTSGSGAGHVEVIAVSPTGRLLDCPVSQKGGVYSATFQPDEPGEWNIQVKHSGNPINDQPYTCFVFDPNGIKVDIYLLF